MAIGKAWLEHSRITCNCGHYPKDHYNREGFCGKCGCTWYYPNDNWVLRKRKEKENERKTTN